MEDQSSPASMVSKKDQSLENLLNPEPNRELKAGCPSNHASEKNL